MKSSRCRATWRSVLSVAAAGLWGAALGCAAERSGAAATAERSAPADPGAAKVRVVNAYCPVAGTHPVDESGNKMTTADLTRRWRGQTVGFCCDGRPPFWDEMTDAEREEKLAAAMELERRGGPGAK